MPILNKKSWNEKPGKQPKQLRKLNFVRRKRGRPENRKNTNA